MEAVKRNYLIAIFISFKFFFFALDLRFSHLDSALQKNAEALLQLFAQPSVSIP